MTDKEFLNHMAVVSALMGDPILPKICKIIIRDKLEYTIRENNFDVMDPELINKILKNDSEISYGSQSPLGTYKYLIIVEEESVNDEQVLCQRVGFSFKITHLKELIDLNKKGD